MHEVVEERGAVGAQGELQGGVSSLQSLSAIAGPAAMAQLFGYFTSGAAPMQLPGAPFFAAALLSALALAILLRQKLD